MTLEDRIGVSTISLNGIGVAEAVSLIKEAGFGSVEVFVGVPGCGSVGFPGPLPIAGAWPRAMNTGARRALRQRLEGFACVTVHAQILDTNIASLNAGIREESVQQHLECFGLAADIGAPIVTFHPARPGLATSAYGDMHADKAHEHNLAFARRAAELAAQTGVMSGFEGPHGAGYPVVDVVRELDHPRFGVLVDTTQGLMGYGCDHAAMLNAIERCRGIIPEAHVHGAIKRSIGLTAHLPLRMNNVVDFPRILAKLNEVGFDGPFMFEMTPSSDPREVIRYCQDSKELLLGWCREAGFA